MEVRGACGGPPIAGSDQVGEGRAAVQVRRCAVQRWGEVSRWAKVRTLVKTRSHKEPQTRLPSCPICAAYKGF